jgi:hypothetical protein
VAILRKWTPAIVALSGFLLLWAGCSLMPEEEPVPEELAVLFTASTSAELEPCG